MPYIYQLVNNLKYISNDKVKINYKIYLRDTVFDNENDENCYVPYDENGELIGTSSNDENTEYFLFTIIYDEIAENAFDMK